MSHLYAAHVLFPTTALMVPAIEEAFFALSRDQRSIDGNIALVLDKQASYGDIPITALLQQYQIPYDHHHADHHECQEWTMQARYVQGRCVLDSVTDAQLEMQSFAEQVLSLLEAGNQEEALGMLAKTARRDQDDRSIQQLVTDWELSDLFVLYAASEKISFDTGYWSNLEGWGKFDNVDVFTKEQMVAFGIPAAQLNDAIWVTVPAAIEQMNKTTNV